MPVPSLITDLSQTAASNFPQGSDSPSNLDDTQRAHGSFIAMLRDGKGFSNPVTLASAATVDIGGQNSLSVEITGVTTITSFGITYNGPRFLRFTGALVLTHNATTLNLPGAANITTAAGDTALALPNSALNGWNVIAFQRASSLPTFPVDLQKQTYTSATTTGTAPTYVAAMSPAITALVANKTRANLTFNVSNSGVASTLNVDGTGVIGLKQYDSTGAKVDPTIVASMNSDVVYDGSNWVLMNQLPSALSHGQCRLTLSAGSLKLYPYNGNRLIVNGVSCTVPDAGVTLAPTGLTANTLYYIYATQSGGVINALEASTTSHSTDTATGNKGVEIKTGDSNRTLVGMAYPTAGPVFVDSGASRLVLSYFNRLGKEASVSITGGSTTSASMVELNTADRVFVLAWGDDAISCHMSLSTLSNSSGSAWATTIGIDAGTYMYGQFSGGSAINQYQFYPSMHRVVTEGFHYVSPRGQISGGATLTLQGGGTSSNFVRTNG